MFIGPKPSFSRAFVATFVSDALRAVVSTLRGSHAQAVRHLSPHPHRQSFLSTSCETMVLWSLMDRWTKSRSLSSRINLVQARFAVGGDKIMAVETDNTLLVWDHLTFVLEARIEVPVGYGVITCFDPSHDCLSVVVGDSTGSLHLYDLKAETLLRTAHLPPSAHSVLQIRIDAVGQYTAVLGDDGRILFLKFNLEQCLVAFEVFAPLQRFTAFDLDPGFRYLVGTLTDGTIRLHDLISLKSAAKIDSQKLLRSESPYGGFSGDDAALPGLVGGLTGQDGKAGYSVPISTPTPDILDSLFSGLKIGGKKSVAVARSAASVRKGEERKIQSQKNKGGMRWEPLYRLLSLEPKNGRLTPSNLQALLDSYGQYPDKYRLLVWKFLLKLPENIGK